MGTALATGDLWDTRWFTAESVAQTINELREEYGNPEQRFGVYALDGLDPRSLVGRAVEVERLGREYGNDARLLRDLYGTFEEIGKTELLCVVDHERLVPAGVMRLVQNTTEHGSRTMNDLQAHSENGWGQSWESLLERSDFRATSPDEILDIPTVAVAEDYASGRRADGVSRALLAAVFNRCLTSPTKTMICAMERIPYQLLQAYSSGFFHEFEGLEAQPYYGAPDTVALWSNQREYERYLFHCQPETYRRFRYFEGLDMYFFGFPEGPSAWEPIADDEVVIDLRNAGGDHSRGYSHSIIDLTTSAETQEAAPPSPSQ